MDRIKQLTLALARNTFKSDLAQNLMRDIKSLRTLWNWLYMALYAWICVWTVLYHPDAIPTVVTVTGGVVSVIFTGYVLTKTYEKVKNGNGNGNHKPPGGDENDASD
ncbi:MAG: hypothetical protein A2270_10465 [Elusimicrobia bacterium RIFOXYA12_FULL_51_18]|nr:MAG: hypothetical protein A2270_10465 [Elusimicrobia bacterium RIFOXYA12_FULL_51_18]OGS29513.1 MAG: hypothetical protein A2218_00725 [Elusimicrobia bacterium RIFOXYA2_FULL_53_38]